MARIKIGREGARISPLPSTAGADFRLSGLRGHSAVVLYFYPKDATSGCTTEAQEFRDLHARFRRAGAQVFGVSRDSIASHAKFRAAQGPALPPAQRRR